MPQTGRTASGCLFSMVHTHETKLSAADAPDWQEASVSASDAD